MKSFRKSLAILMGIFFLFAMAVYSPSPAMAQKAGKKAQEATAAKARYNEEAW